jgi:hypothetical protein
VFSNQVNGINAKILSSPPKTIQKELQSYKKSTADLEKSNIREIYIWAKIMNLKTILILT